MASGFEQAALQFLHTYGYVALFVLLALETAMILHFVPSEVIVTVAAATLATNGIQLVLVIAVSTLGATAGSLMLYGFARYGRCRFLDRDPRFFGLNQKRRARLESWFQHPSVQPWSEVLLRGSASSWMKRQTIAAARRSARGRARSRRGCSPLTRN